jgi:hypothetical protein
MGRFAPAAIGGGTGRLLLVVDDPAVVSAVAAGARLTSEVAEEHGWFLGRLVDPFGHELGVRFTQEPTAMGPVTRAVLDDTCGNLVQIAAQSERQGGWR